MLQFFGVKRSKVKGHSITRAQPGERKHTELDAVLGVLISSLCCFLKELMPLSVMILLVRQQERHPACNMYSSLLVFCCSSRSMTPVTETHHRHLSSARFFAISYPSHMLLITCSLFLPLVRFILPSRMSRNNTSYRRTCPNHLRFR